MRRASRLDRNHRDVVEAFESMGCVVFDASGVGRGFPDLVVSLRRVNHLVEVKASAKKKLTGQQQVFWAAWRGTVDRVNDLGDVVALVRKWTKEGSP